MFVIFMALLITTNLHSTGAEFDIAAEANSNRFMLDAIIRQLFELFRNVIRNGSEKKGIPVMDPYEFEQASFDTIGKMFSMTANITDGVFNGLGNYELISFNFSKADLSMELNLNLLLITFESEYFDFDGNIYGAIPISGKGRLHIEAHNVVLKGKVYLKQSEDSKSILLSHFEDMQFNIENLKSRTHFDNNTDGIFDAMVEDLLATYLSRFSKVICATYGDTVIRLLNNILDKFESWHIIAVIL